MNDRRTSPGIDSPRPLRAERRAAGLVAEYIHELSDRHAGPRDVSPAAAGRPRPGAADHDSGSQGA
jgi:hypothetical protein